MLNPLCRCLLMALLAGVLAACGGVPRTGSVDTAPAAAPALPTWTPGAVQRYEQDAPGLGVSRRYQSSAGWLDLYLYDLRRSWLDGTADPGFSAHFDSTIADVREVARRGRYTDLQVGAPNEVTIDGQPLRRVRYSLQMSGKRLHSATYLTARGGRLLKLRITVDPAHGHDVDALAEDFLRGYFKRVAVPGGVSA